MNNVEQVVKYEYTADYDVNPDEQRQKRIVFRNVGERLAEPYRTKFLNKDVTINESCRCISAAIEGKDVVVYYEVPKVSPTVFVDYANTYDVTITIDKVKLVFYVNIRLSKVA